MSGRVLKRAVETPEAAEQALRLDDYLPYRLVMSSSAVSRLIARAYEARFGLSIPQWRVICVLAEDGASAVGVLVQRTGMDGPAVAEALQGLKARGLVSPQAAAPAHEPLAWRLSDQGLALHEAIAPLALAYEAALISGLAPQEVALLKRLLARVQAAAEALAGETRPPSAP
jgi:DNA-binding MarR family transcriptional regulator